MDLSWKYYKAIGFLVKGNVVFRIQGTVVGKGIDPLRPQPLGNPCSIGNGECIVDPRSTQSRDGFGQPRKALGLRTVFNVLGPLSNPAGARRQVVGVYDEALVETMARVLGELGAEQALVFHGAGGLDEISTIGPTKIAEWNGSSVDVYQVKPADFGIETATLNDLAGGDSVHNAAAIRSIFAGEAGPQADVVALNAAAAIYVAGAANDLEEGLRKARKAIDSGAAAQCLDALVNATRRASS